METRKTKAQNYLTPGSRGLLYCSATHAFTVPFITVTAADAVRIERDIWSEPWVLPFEIEPLGRPEKQIATARALHRWPLLQQRMSKRGGVPAAMNLTGATAFSPVEISERDWQFILRDLAD